jgi:drug/metabolite transporter (DMT)-like permease
MRTKLGPWLPALAVLTAVFMFSLIELLVRHLMHRYALHQVVWLRSAAALPFLSLALLMSQPRTPVSLGTLPPLTWSVRWKLHLLRSVLGTFSMACIFFAVSQIPLGTAAAMTATAPFFVLLMSRRWLGEEVHWQRWCGVGLGFVGVCLVTGPQISAAWVGMASALSGALCSACLMVLLRYLAQREAAAHTALLNATGITAWASMGLLLWGGQSLASSDWWLVLLMGALGGLAHLVSTWAYQHAKAGAMAPLGFSACVWAMLLGFVVFDEVPSAVALLGTATIMAGGYWATRETTTR